MQNINKETPATGIPAGLEALYVTCKSLYPNQTNPLQVTALVKYWLGGPDPLDYISMYHNAGNEELGIPPHWHYISFGLSDLHGDGRVHEVTPSDQPSGFGIELTMRVKQKDGEQTPPTWPAAIMQALAKYVFQSETVFCVGDHISWHSALDGSCDSIVRHMLVSHDLQLGTKMTPFGIVHFVQLVGITDQELKASQHWNGNGVLGIMKTYHSCGGEWLVTDMSRELSIYGIDAEVQSQVQNGIDKEGSNLSGVSARLTWAPHDRGENHNKEINRSDLDKADLSSLSLTSQQTQQIKSTLRKGLLNAALNEANSVLGLSNSNSSEDNNSNSDPNITKNDNENNNIDRNAANGDPISIEPLSYLHLSLNLEAGALLPLALSGRLKHGRHFTFKSLVGPEAVTLVTPSIEGSFVTPATPFAVKGSWLQVLINSTLLTDMSNTLGHLTQPQQVKVPVTFDWKDHNISITIVAEDL